MYPRLIHQCGFGHRVSGHAAGLRSRMLRRSCVNLFRCASNGANGVQYLAYRMAQAKQFVVELDLVLLVAILQAFFKDVMEMRRYFRFHWHDGKSPFRRILAMMSTDLQADKACARRATGARTQSSGRAPSLG